MRISDWSADVGSSDLLVNETLNDAVARHVPFVTRSTLTLTGGRDSRLLAGILGKLGRRPVAVPFGAAADFEMLCAGGVARALGRSEDRRVGKEGVIERRSRWSPCSDKQKIITL